MSFSITAFALRRAIRPMIKPRHFSSLASSLAAPRVLAPKTLTPSRILSPISVRFASTKAVNAEDKIRRTDENLLRVLEDEIECAQEADEQPPQEAELPKDFPFVIIDNPGDQSIILKREFQGEKIQVAVFMNFDEDADEEESQQDAAEGQNTDDNLQPHISLVVTIDKGAGPTLEFCCNLDAVDFEIESMAMKRPEDSHAEDAYEGPDFSDLDEGLQRALRKYLGARGIKVSLYEFLREYMMTKDDKEYIVWLKNLKEFVEK